MPKKPKLTRYKPPPVVVRLSVAQANVALRALNNFLATAIARPHERDNLRFRLANVTEFLLLNDIALLNVGVVNTATDLSRRAAAVLAPPPVAPAPVVPRRAP